MMGCEARQAQLGGGQDYSSELQFGEWFSIFGGELSHLQEGAG